MVDYQFSQSTFPINNRISQHADTIDEDDQYFECTLLAGKILGVRCNDSVISGYFQITADPYAAKTAEERREFESFNNYFYKNYGKEDDHCYFQSKYEAFYNLIKAWFTWKEILSDDEKILYVENL